MTVTDITLTDKQGAAVKAIVEWYRTKRKEQQVFRLFGYAGVGKSTILKYALDELGAEAMPRVERSEKIVRVDFRKREIVEDEPEIQRPPKVLSAAFTGKAALVMTRKDTPASTIHSLCYAVMDATPESVAAAKEALAYIQNHCPAGYTRAMWETAIRDQQKAIKEMYRPHFTLNLQSPIVDADLIVLDEVSMVGEEMANDLLSFNKPILVLGDPGQLPPIKGEGYFTEAEPDVMLTEIHRQAEDSAIVRLATMAREGRRIPFGRHSDEVWKMQRNQVPIEALLKSGQVLCGFNATRFYLNNQLRAVSGLSGELPSGTGEKIICLKNRNDEGLINGQFLTLDNITDAGELSFYADIMTEDGQEIGQKRIYRGHFDDHTTFDKDRGERDYFKKKGMVEATYGWAITTHKAQGSQWENVCLYDDGFGRGPDRLKWLYTAITRAESGLLILE